MFLSKTMTVSKGGALRACISACVVAGLCVVLMSIPGAPAKGVVAMGLFYTIVVSSFHVAMMREPIPAKAPLRLYARLFGTTLLCGALAAGCALGVVTLLERLNLLKPIPVFLVMFISGSLSFLYSFRSIPQERREQNRGTEKTD